MLLKSMHSNVRIPVSVGARLNSEYIRKNGNTEYSYKRVRREYPVFVGARLNSEFLTHSRRLHRSRRSGLAPLAATGAPPLGTGADPLDPPFSSFS